MRTRAAFLLTVVTIAGCSTGDPALDRLTPGSQAEVIAPEGATGAGSDLCINGRPRGGPGSAVVLPAGVRVTVGEDPGIYDRSQAAINEDANFWKRSPERREKILAEKPATYAPPEPNPGIGGSRSW